MKKLVVFMVICLILAGCSNEIYEKNNVGIEKEEKSTFKLLKEIASYKEVELKEVKDVIEEVDLNGDEKKEKISIESKEHSFKLYINGAKYENEVAADKIIFMDLNKKDKYTEAAIYYDMESADYTYEILRYDGKSILKLGEVYEGVGQVYADENGTIAESLYKIEFIDKIAFSKVKKLVDNTLKIEEKDINEYLKKQYTLVKDVEDIYEFNLSEAYGKETPSGDEYENPTIKYFETFNLDPWSEEKKSTFKKGSKIKIIEIREEDKVYLIEYERTLNDKKIVGKSLVRFWIGD